MKLSSNIKNQISKVIIEQYPYNRPTAEEVMEKLSFDINEQDPADILQYIEADLETRSFESDENFTDKELNILQFLINQDILYVYRMSKQFPKFEEDVKTLRTLQEKVGKMIESRN